MLLVCGYDFVIYIYTFRSVEDKDEGVIVVVWLC